MILDELISANDIEHRRQLIRDVMDYRLDGHEHIPVLVTHFPNSNGYTLTEVFKDKEIQLEYELDKIKSSLLKVPGGDYIPSIKSDLGYIVIRSIFGMRTVYSSDRRPAKYPDQAPYVDPLTKPIKSIEDMYRFKRPKDIFSRGLIPEGFERVRHMMEATNHEIPTSNLDCGNGFLMAYELTDTELFFTTMRDDPKAIHNIIYILTDIIIDIESEVIKIAGGIDNITSTEWDEKWLLEGKKCLISADLQPLYNPDDYSLFELPYCNRQFSKFGPGFIHNCGPQTTLEYFWDHNPRPYGITCEYYSCLGDYERIKEVFRQHHRAVAIVEFTNMKDSDEMAAAFKNLMDVLAPDVIAIPWMWVGPIHICQEDPAVINSKLMKVSKEYMKRMQDGQNQ